jgi:hypothetical protein
VEAEVGKQRLCHTVEQALEGRSDVSCVHAAATARSPASVTFLYSS